MGAEPQGRTGASREGGGGAIRVEWPEKDKDRLIRLMVGVESPGAEVYYQSVHGTPEERCYLVQIDEDGKRRAGPILARIKFRDESGENKAAWHAARAWVEYLQEASTGCVMDRERMMHKILHEEVPEAVEKAWSEAFR